MINAVHLVQCQEHRKFQISINLLQYYDGDGDGDDDDDGSGDDYGGDDNISFK